MTERIDNIIQALEGIKDTVDDSLDNSLSVHLDLIEKIISSIS